MLESRKGIYSHPIDSTPWKKCIETTTSMASMGEDYRKHILCMPSMSNKECPNMLLKLYKRLLKDKCIMLDSIDEDDLREFIDNEFLSDDLLFTTVNKCDINYDPVEFSYEYRYYAEGNQKLCQIEVGLLFNDMYKNVLLLKSTKRMHQHNIKFSLPKGHVDFDQSHYTTSRKDVLLNNMVRELAEEIVPMDKGAKFRITHDMLVPVAIMMGSSQPSDMEHLVIVYGFKDMHVATTQISQFTSNEPNKHKVTKVSISSMLPRRDSDFISATKALLGRIQ